MSRRHRIERARVRRVKLPLEQVYVSSMYVMDSAYRTVVELTTDSGLVGLGETVGGEDVFALTAGLAKSALGQSIADRAGLQRSFARIAFDNRAGRNGWSAFAGVELAFWDLAGKAWDLPVHDLLGGAVRRDIGVVCPVPAAIVERPLPRAELAEHFQDRDNVRHVVAYALRQARMRGFRTFKYKSAAASREWDVAVMRALREALGPETGLRFDPNAAYGTAEAIALCARLEPLQLEFYEDPTAGLDGMAQVRARMTRPVATNMCVIQLDHLSPAIRCRAVDFVLADVFMWGGIANYRDLVAAADAGGLEVAIHSFFETGIGTAVNLHLAAAFPTIVRPNDSGLHVLADDVLAGPRLPIRDGRMEVPAGPGFGVALDEAKMERYTVAERDFAA